jgi:hypothetical protein
MKGRERSFQRKGSLSWKGTLATDSGMHGQTGFDPRDVNSMVKRETVL